MVLRRGRTRVVTAAAVVAVAVAAVLAVAAAIDLDPPPGQAGPSLVRLSAAPLGVNVGPWDGAYAGHSASFIQPKLKAARISQLRYGGGSYADYYDWETSTNIGNCLPDTTASFTSRCASGAQVTFAGFSKQARAISAESFVTVNYGSGTPALAAAWVSRAAHTSGQQVALWEVGNESYGCWEVNNPLAGPPANFKGYKPATTAVDGHYPTCPTTTQGSAAGIKTLATSYAVNALRFMKAMKAADPSAMIGVPWALDTSASGTAVTDDSTWNNIVLGADGAYVSFVDAHYYPLGFSGSTGGGNPSDSDVLQSLRQIPRLMTTIKAGLAAHDPSASVVIGETALSNSTTTTVCTPVGAVFAAGDVLSWLAAGARSVDWWDLNDDGNTGASCVNPDFGLFTSAARPAPETPYFGYLLASELAQPGARLGVLPTTGAAAADVLAFQAVMPNGANAVAFLNLNADASSTVAFSAPSGLSGTLRSLTYSAGTQNAAKSEIVSGTTSASALSSGITLPAESITVVKTQ